MCCFLEPNQYFNFDVLADIHTFNLNNISALKASSIYKTCFRLYRRRKPPTYLCVNCVSNIHHYALYVECKDNEWSQNRFLKQQCCVTEQFCTYSINITYTWATHAPARHFLLKERKKQGCWLKQEMRDGSRQTQIFSGVDYSDELWQLPPLYFTVHIILLCSMKHGWETAVQTHPEGNQTLH